ALADALARCAQLGASPFGERCGADGIECRMRGTKLITGVTSAPLAAQPFAVQQVGAPEFYAQWGAAEALDRLAVTGLSVRAVADQRARARADAQCPVGPAGASVLREPMECSGRALGQLAPRRGLDELGNGPVGEPDRG